MSQEELGLPDFNTIKRAAVASYEEKALMNPVLDEVARETSEEVILGFEEFLELPDEYLERIKTGLYRIYMDFVDKGPRSNDDSIDVINLKTIVGTFQFLANIFENDWDKITVEFLMLPVSMEISAMAYDLPNFDSHDAKFGFLLAMVFETGSVTGLNRRKT